MINADHNYATECHHFLFRKSWIAFFRQMTDAQAGVLIKKICDYATGIDEPPEDPVVNAAYGIATAQLNDSCKRHIENLYQKGILR